MVQDGGDIERKANKIVDDVKLSQEQRSMRPLINDIQDFQTSDSKNFASIMSAANQKLDAAFPQTFQLVDLVGVKNGELIMRDTRFNEEVAFSADGKLRVLGIPGAKHVANSDGSSLDLLKQPDGKDHPVRVVHPDGQISSYTYDSSGKPTTVTEWSPQGQKTVSYTRSGDSWNKTAGEGPASFRGSLSVADDGSHVFRDLDGNTSVRKSDGSVTVTAKSGQVLMHTDAVARASTSRPVFPLNNSSGPKR